MNPNREIQLEYGTEALAIARHYNFVNPKLEYSEVINRGNDIWWIYEHRDYVLGDNPPAIARMCVEYALYTSKQVLSSTQ